MLEIGTSQRDDYRVIMGNVYMYCATSFCHNVSTLEELRELLRDGSGI